MHVDIKPDFNDRMYFSLSEYLRKKFAQKVGKISVDTNFGCDHSSNSGGCIFCNMDSYRPNNTNYKDIENQISQREAKSRYNKYYIYFQLGTPLSNTNEIQTLSIANELIKMPNCIGLQFGARSDMLSDHALSVLNELAIKSGKEIWLEMGLQSSNDQTLRFINRGHDYDNFASMVCKIDREYKAILVCSHVVFGLPKSENQIETYDEMLKTVDDLSSLPVASVKYHHLQVVKNTSLEKIYSKNQFHTFGDDEYIDFIIEALKHTNENFVISRLIGDSISDYLVAPIWSKNKTTMLETINNRMKNQKIHQGKL